MKKDQTIIRKKQREIKYNKRQNNFDIDILKREIFHSNNGKYIDDIFREDLEDKEVSYHESKKF